MMEREHVGDLGIGGKIILNFTFKKLVGDSWTGLLRLRIGTVGRLL
jgi:hypothetical protein